MRGLIVKLITRLYFVKTDSGIFKCKSRGKLRLDGSEPLVGDEVEISVQEDDEGIIDRILKRRNVLKRPRVANAAGLVIIIAPKPEPDFEFLDRLLIQAEANDIVPIICLNKTDLDAGDALISEVKSRYEATSYPIILISCYENRGLEELKAVLVEGINVFSGQSGVGKSSIINALLPDMTMEVGGLSEKLNRGRHTTRHSELTDMGNGVYICDSPGFSSFEYLGLSSTKLIYHMPDLAKHLGNCRFMNCKHLKEPDCALRAAISEGEINEHRYNSYVRFLAELEAAEKSY